MEARASTPTYDMPKLNGVVVSIVIFLLCQTIGAVWWAGSISTRQNTMLEQISEIKCQINVLTQNGYSKADAARDLAVRDRMIDDVARRAGSVIR